MVPTTTNRIECADFRILIVTARGNTFKSTFANDGVTS